MTIVGGKSDLKSRRAVADPDFAVVMLDVSFCHSMAKSNKTDC